MKNPIAPPSETEGVWIRLPRPRTFCALTGLSRSALWEFVKTHGVRTVALRRPGALKGARLVSKSDLLAKLDALATAEPATTSTSVPL
jgi:predicted DNA-binding transcriptional regulator AlpA